MKKEPIIWKGIENFLPIPQSLDDDIFCENLLEHASIFFNIPKEVIVSKTRKRTAVIPRQFCHCIYLSAYKNRAKAALYFGSKNRATTYNSQRTIQNLLDNYVETRDLFLRFNDEFVEYLFKKFPKLKREKEPITFKEIQTILESNGKNKKEILSIKNELLDELLRKVKRDKDYVPKILVDVLF